MKELPKLVIGQPVRVKAQPQRPESMWLPGQVINVAAPRSYIVEVNGRQYRRNRVHIRDSSTPPPAPVPTVPQIPVTPRSTTKQQAVPNSPNVNTDRPPSISSSPVSIPSPPSTPAIPRAGNVRTTRSGRRVITPHKYRE